MFEPEDSVVSNKSRGRKMPKALQKTIETLIVQEREESKSRIEASRVNETTDVKDKADDIEEEKN